MMIVLAVLCGLVAAVNLVQVMTGRQLIRPSTSRRSADQLRKESAAAAVATSGLALGLLHWHWGPILAVLGYSALLIARRSARNT